MKLIGSLTSPYVRKVRVMLLEKGLPFEFVMDSPWEASSRISEFNPLGKVPALITDEGETLFDSNILAEYLEQLPGAVPKFLPSDRAEALRVRQIATLADGVCDAAVAVVLEGRRAAEKRDADWVGRQKGKIERGLTTLDARLGERAWLYGDALTLADISTVCMLLWIDFRLPDFGWRSRYPALVRLADKLAARPSFAQTMPPA